jgi:hypothetical protein
VAVIKIDTNYYQQFDADYTKEIPAKGYGGWKKAKLDLNLDKTAVVLMHSMYYGTMEEVPGIFRACEYIPRAYEIGKNIMPDLLKTIRDSGMQLIHVAAGAGYCSGYEGYKKALEIGGEAKPIEQVESDPVMDGLKKFKTENAFPGKHNLPSYEKGAKIFDFDENAKPEKDELIVENEAQLLAICKKYGINHLIYIGYNINWCIMFSSGGFMHIFRNGVMCSTIRQAVTAVENKESAEDNMGKELALWTIAVGFGFVYDLDDFTDALKQKE